MDSWTAGWTDVIGNGVVVVTLLGIDWVSTRERKEEKKKHEQMKERKVLLFWLKRARERERETDLC